MGNALYVENNAGDVKILDANDKDICQGNDQITKQQAQALYDGQYFMATTDRCL